MKVRSCALGCSWMRSYACKMFARIRPVASQRRVVEIFHWWKGSPVTTAAEFVLEYGLKYWHRSGGRSCMLAKRITYWFCLCHATRADKYMASRNLQALPNPAEKSRLIWLIGSFGIARYYCDIFRSEGKKSKYTLLIYSINVNYF